MFDLWPSGTNVVADVLARHWGIKHKPVQSHLGVSRATWRIGGLYWLSQAEHMRFAELSRQATVLLHLTQHLKSRHVSISVPEIVGSQAGDLVVADAGYVWCLTHALPGFHPEAGNPDIYQALTEGLATFHSVLRTLPQDGPSHVPAGICVTTRQAINRLTLDPFVAFTPDPCEKDVLQGAAAWLLPRLNGFEQLPRQIVHGDWTPRNVLFQRADRQMRLTGVLDLEAMAWDPACVDVANTCSTLLMWSGLDKLEKRMEEVVQTYERSAGVYLDRTQIRTAMLAHWFCHYWRWRDRLQYGEFGHEVKRTLCLRISSVLSYVSSQESCQP